MLTVMGGNSAEMKLRQIFRFPLWNSLEKVDLQDLRCWSEWLDIQRRGEEMLLTFRSLDSLSGLISLIIGNHQVIIRWLVIGWPSGDYHLSQVISLVSHLFHLMPKSALDQMDSPEKVSRVFRVLPIIHNILQLVLAVLVSNIVMVIAPPMI